MLPHGPHFRRLSATVLFSPAACGVFRCQKQCFTRHAGDQSLDLAWLTKPREMDKRGKLQCPIPLGVTLAAHQTFLGLVPLERRRLGSQIMPEENQ